MKIASRQGGFTLLEIMLVVMIIALLLGGAIVEFAPNINMAKDTKVKEDLQTISTQLWVYNSRNNGGFPTTDQGLQALVTKPSDAPVGWTSAFPSGVPLDPWGVPYRYMCPGTRHPESFDLWSSGPDKQNGTADDIYANQ